MKLPTVRPKELVKILEKRGCIFKRQTGSHRIFYYPQKQRIIVVPIHAKELKKDYFIQLLKN